MLPVLLDEYVDKKNVSRLKRVIGEWQPASKLFEDGLALVVKSPGGDPVAAVEFIEYLNELEKAGLQVSVNIFDAPSVAAIVALSVGSKRRMSRTGSIEFHRGSLKLEAADIDLETGKISQPILAQFRMYDMMLHRILTEYGISKDPKMMSTLYGSGWLPLSPEQCLELKLVDELF